MQILWLAVFVLFLCATAVAGGSRPGRGLPAGRMDVLYSMEVETPHVKWADPLGGGAIRVWMMPSVVGGRDVVEIAQRLTLEYDTLTLDASGYNAWGFGDFYGKRGGAHGRSYDTDYQYLTEDLTSDIRYDVLVIPGTHPWHELPEAARKAVLRRVREGAGLVLIAPNCDPERLGELEEMSPLIPPSAVPAAERAEPQDALPGMVWRRAAPHFIADNVPLDVLPFEQMSLRPYRARGEVLIEAGGKPVLAVKECGKGRVVAFGYANFGFSPRVTDPWAVDKAYPYWEYYYSLLCRAIAWAAKREPEVRLTELSASGDGAPKGVSIALAGEDREITVELTVRDERYQQEAQHSYEVELSSGRAEFSVPLPGKLSGGLHFADVVLRTSEGVLDWGSAAFETTRAVAVTGIELSRDVVQVGERIAGRAMLRAGSPTTASVRLWFEDNYGRLLDRREQRLEVPGESAIAFELSTAHCLSRLGRIICEVADGGQVFDRKEAPLFVRIPQAWEDYEIIMDRFLPEPAPGRWPAIAKQLEKMNVSVMGAISPQMSEHVNFKIQADVVAQGFHPRHFGSSFWENKRAFVETADKKHLVREPCYTDPAYRERFRQTLTEETTQFARFSPVSYYAYEEPSLTYFEQALDLCWSPTCLAGFRGWLRSTYGSLQAFNEEWGTSYTSWEAVLPLTTAEAQESGNYPPWADFRTWMEVMYADVYREGRDIIRAIDPNATICLSGNQRGTPYNGYDYARINRYIDQMQQYTGANLEEFNRSLYPHVLCTGCTGYGVSDPHLSLQLWSRLLNGDTAGCVIFWEISCLNPDLTFCRSGADLARHFAELRGDGIARLLAAAERDNCGIAIYYSYPSLHGTWVTDADISEGRGSGPAGRMFDDDRIAWTQLLEGLGYQYDFVSYDAVAAGVLAERGYRLLIMPETVAVSEAEAKAIEEFAERGGAVISDIWPAVMDEHCKWREGGRLDSLFGISHKTLEPGDFRRTSSWERVDLAGGQQGWCEGHPEVARHSRGKGKTFHLGTSLAPLLGDDRAKLPDYMGLVAKLLGEAGVSPPAMVTNEHGRPAATCESVTYHAGSADYFGIVRYRTPAEGDPEADGAVPPLSDARGALPENTVRVTFAEPRHIYDVRQREYLGLADRVQAQLGLGEAKVYARLPYQVESVDVAAPAEASAGEEVRYQVRVSTTEPGQPGTHVAIARVYSPDGRERPAYQGRLTLKEGRGEGVIRLALNDPAGGWRIVARDAATGTEGVATFAVRQARATRAPG